MKPVRILRPAVKRLVPQPVRDRVRAWLRAKPLAGIYTLAEDEADLIRAELAARGDGAWSAPRTGRSTAGMDERVVEIPWVLSRYRGERRVLDVGTAWSLPVYKSALESLGIPELHGVDLVVKPVSGVMMTRADVRQLPYADGVFDLVICISTLEHIGLDNTEYGTSGRRQVDGDLLAMREFRRVLSPKGRLLITVPFGLREQLDWLRQYDQAQWDELIGGAGMTSIEVAHYAYGDVRGWRQEEPSRIHGHFQEKGASASTGVLCAQLAPAGSPAGA